MKYSIVSLFSGSGGLDLGFLQTGKFEILLANDFFHEAVLSYRHNIGNHIVEADVKTLIDLPKADVLIGGPPCQGYSNANPGRTLQDPRNELYKEYLRVLKLVEPKIFVMENVQGMLTIDSGKFYIMMKSLFSAEGYTLYDKVLNAADYGVAQNRKRNFLVGIKSSISEQYNFPIPLETKVTVKQALANIPKAVFNHVVGKLTPLNKQRLQHIPAGGSMADCPKSLQNGSDIKRAMRRLPINGQSWTIVHNNCDHYYHPTRARRVTIREMARLQSYPDSYEFFGSKSQQSIQVGNSVPVLLGKALAESIIVFLDKVKTEVAS